MRVDLREVDAAIGEGFGFSEVGEDQFDSVVGLLGMLAVVQGIRADGAPKDEVVKTTEGWIFGQTSKTTSLNGRGDR